MTTPIIGDLLESTIGKVVGRLTDRFLPSTMTEEEKGNFQIEARRLAMEEYAIAIKDVDSARVLAGKESDGAPPWTKILTVTHRPMWSYVILGLFSWTIIAPYMGFPAIELTTVHKDIMQTVIIFYFGGRSIEKTVGLVKGGS